MTIISHKWKTKKKRKTKLQNSLIQLMLTMSGSNRNIHQKLKTFHFFFCSNFSQQPDSNNKTSKTREGGETDIRRVKENRRVKKLSGTQTRWNSKVRRRRNGRRGKRQRRRWSGLEFGHTRGIFFRQSTLRLVVVCGRSKEVRKRSGHERVRGEGEVGEGVCTCRGI